MKRVDANQKFLVVDILVKSVITLIQKEAAFIPAKSDAQHSYDLHSSSQRPGRQSLL